VGSVAAFPLAAQALTPLEERVREQCERKDEEKARLISGWIETSFTANFDNPKDNQNFGRLFDDRSNELVVNQAVVNFERGLKKGPEFDWGFKLQLLFGTDARYLHSLGLRFHQVENGEYQGDVPELYLSLHLPVLTFCGLDIKVGKFVTLAGYETVDPKENPFYSHTYIFNFGVPTNHTGVLLTLHVSKALDLMAGVTRGVNTSVDDNNDALAFHGGFNLTLHGEDVVLGAATHIGPESTDDDSDLRYINDVWLTWDINEHLKSITEINYVRDNLADADAYGAAEYLTYSISEGVSASIRAEVWRDDKGFYVAQYANALDSLRSFAGQSTLDPRSIAGGRTTYAALTIGLNFKVSMPKPLALRIRPELRVDRSLNDKKAFNDSTDDRIFTAAVDAIVTF
jgi:Putative beta-barrel porin-2, OmpL-like. bbp2